MVEDAASLKDRDGRQWCGLDMYDHSAAARGEEAQTFERGGDVCAHLPEQRKKARRQEIVWGRKRVVRAAFEDDGGWAFGDKQGGQDGLEHEGSAAGRADLEGVVAGCGAARKEGEFEGADSVAGDVSPADGGCGLYGSEVLSA